MERFRIMRYSKFIITCLLAMFIIFFLTIIPDVKAQDESPCLTVSSFDEFVSSIKQIQSTGGTMLLTEDITIPESESLTYNNGRYRKEVIVETGGHTIDVEGYLELWPYLTIRGNGSQAPLFHISPGGELHLVSICLDAGEAGVAIVQEEGSILTYGSEESMGLPGFTCIGEIRSAKTMTTAAYWKYNLEKLPIVRVPDGVAFTADMLPDKVFSIVNRDHKEYEEDVSVAWDDETFPDEHERTLVQGRFADGYSQYEDYRPSCLVIWESDTNPFFLNVYLKSATQWYDMVFMYGESPQSGMIYVQSSDDGETWTEIDGTEGYTPVESEENGSFSWILSYSKTDDYKERPKYYRLFQILDDGTELYSETLQLHEGLIFTASDIEGGRGGETSPNEGENQLPNNIQNEEKNDQISTSEPQNSSSDKNVQSDDFKRPENEPGRQEVRSATVDENGDSNIDIPSAPESSSSSNTGSEDAEQTMEESYLTSEPEEMKTKSKQSKETENLEKLTGSVFVMGILIGSVLFSVLRRKNK